MAEAISKNKKDKSELNWAPGRLSEDNDEVDP